MIRTLNRLQPWGILLIRLVLGSSMAYHGFEKLIPPSGLHAAHPSAGLEYSSAFVVHLGLPRWLGYASVLTEFFGGLLLLFGLLTRLAAFLVAIDLVAALIMVNLHKGYGGLGYSGPEHTLALIAMATLLVLTGAGALSVDRRSGLR